MRDSGERILQERLGTRERAGRFRSTQVLDHLNERMCAFIAGQNMMFLATSDAEGACDNTLRAGPTGFVVVLDEQRLCWPEYRGNGVLSSRGNILENPHVGLLFVDFVDDVIGLHVNGRAALVDDLELPGVEAATVAGRKPEQWVVARVEEAYIHCAKFIPRMRRAPVDGHDFHPSTKKSDYFATVPSAANPTPAKPAESPRPAQSPNPAESPRPAECEKATEATPRPDQATGLRRLLWRRSRATGTVSRR
jgi:predicted pyridoxine 5'-phosphate oxidase superfamily flavin-nucleotide-binding protein